MNQRETQIEAWKANRKTKYSKEGSNVIQWGEGKSLLLSEISWIEEPLISIHKTTGDAMFNIDIHLKNTKVITHETKIKTKTKVIVLILVSILGE